ncbi:hypothetical protein CEK26_011429 [Fusarium fujikuroi]|uniref:Xylanolytic transcriptional activator regulatory domain-containing protein n=1 Tax=Fusarium fujikuroi TaxID=5127 RepID=A0A5Q3DMI8_FUSFU|nr:hypothetical protein CEK27_011448 [Fusarium fujikuroi]QGI98360.1 hypothetical protein CEK26_011429 [Fusarium fujikuroi]VTT78497.1 unnamed protein product [Fusarium fujikuroi]VZI02130.1 unnamed protein product [Fusarium fujikuroi]
MEVQTSRASTSQSHYGSVPSQASPMDMPASVTGGTQRVFELENRDTIRQYLDTYFDKSDIADCVFLHRATTIAEWSQGKLEKTLLKAICASALRFAPTYHSETSPAHNWIKQVQHELVNHMGDISVPKLQALMLVIKFLFSMRFTGDVWVLLSIASRVAFTKRLNYERPAIDPVKQECLRRLMWSIYVVDKVFSGGIEDLTVCPTQRMHIRLPSSHHNFQLGSRSKAPFLRSKNEIDTDLNVLAYLMRLYDIRDRVLRQVILGGASPYLSRGQLRSLDLELTSFEESLPDELQLTDNRLMIMCHSEEARTYTTLHTFLFSSRCDLHRFLIPGIREAVSPEAFGQTPREYIDYCQQQCLQTALRYIDMWSKVRQMETSSRVGTPTFAVVTYQFVNMVDHLAALLPLHGESSLPVIKQKFMDILLIVSGSRAEVGWIGSCVTDIENLIPRLANEYFRSASPGTIRLQEKLHRRSKHAFAPDDEEEEDPAIRPPESNTGEEIPETSLESAAFENPEGQDIWSFPVQGDEQGLTGSTGDGSLGSFSSMGYPLINYDSINSTDMVFGDQELGFPLDPFDLQMNAYTDANAPQY